MVRRQASSRVRQPSTGVQAIDSNQVFNTGKQGDRHAYLTDASHEGHIYLPYQAYIGRAGTERKELFFFVDSDRRRSTFRAPQVLYSQGLLLPDRSRGAKADLHQRRIAWAQSISTISGVVHAIKGDVVIGGQVSEPRQSRLCAQARERRLVAGVEAGVGVAATGRAGTIATATASTSAIATAAGTVTTAAATGATTAAAGTTTNLAGLDVALVDIDDLLLLALTLALGLASTAGNEIILILDESLGTGPLLVDLAALVGLADLQVTAKSQLLLGQLSEVLGVRDALVLSLSGSGGVLGVLGVGLLQLRLSNSLASLLVLLLGLALLGAPALGSLLLGTAGEPCQSSVFYTTASPVNTYPVGWLLAWRSS